MQHLITPAASFYPISPAEVRSLWAQLRRDEPHLLSNFEDFLARVTSQIIEANQEKTEMESALKRFDGFVRPTAAHVTCVVRRSCFHALWIWPFYFLGHISEIIDLCKYTRWLESRQFFHKQHLAWHHIWILSIQKNSNTRQWDPAPVWRNGAANKKWKRQDCAAGTHQLVMSNTFFFTLLILSNTAHLNPSHPLALFTSFITGLKDYERFLSRSQDLELQLSGKEKELEQLFQKQRRVSEIYFIKAVPQWKALHSAVFTLYERLHMHMIPLFCQTVRAVTHLRHHKQDDG